MPKGEERKNSGRDEVLERAVDLEGKLGGQEVYEEN